MAYTSDLRVKNILKDINEDIQSVLSGYGLENKLLLRIFDESKEDSWSWDVGGLSFKDPVTGDLLGSNDAGWYVEPSTPIVIVEGTFGTERGQFGDGQLNRVSHSLSVALNGFIGVTFVPYKGQSFVKKGKNREVSNKINYQNGNLHKGMATVALNYSKSNSGKFLIIDTYDRNTLRDLVVEATLNHFNLNNNLDLKIKNILETMKNYLGNSAYGARSNQTISTLYAETGEELDCQSRFYTQNIAALTTSSKRDGHGLLGKNLIEIYSTDKIIYSIFIRLGKEDIAALARRKSKEFTHLTNNSRVRVLCFDDLIIDDPQLRLKMVAFKEQNLHQVSEKALIKEVQNAFNSARIKVRS
jgi:hypothetical protein